MNDPIFNGRIAAADTPVSAARSAPLLSVLLVLAVSLALNVYQGWKVKAPRQVDWANRQIQRINVTDPHDDYRALVIDKPSILYVLSPSCTFVSVRRNHLEEQREGC